MAIRVATGLVATCVSVLVSATAGRVRLFKHEATRMSMACAYSIEAFGPDAGALPAILEQAFDEVDRIDRLMSHYKTDSALSRINREAALHPVAVEPELFDFIGEAMRYYRESDGAFDITVGPLMKAWGFFRGGGRVPDADALATARTVVGGAHVRLDPAGRTIAFDRQGVELDLGGIAKGYAVDRVAQLLARRGIPAALITAGGSTIYGLGTPPGEPGWRVTVDDAASSPAPIVLHLENRAVSVAGSSEKSFESGGVTYSHIMDPRTARPAQGVRSVLVTTTTGTAGDALDDAFFVMGPERTRAYLARLPQTDAHFTLSDGRRVALAGRR